MENLLQVYLERIQPVGLKLISQNSSKNIIKFSVNQLAQFLQKKNSQKTKS